MFVRAFPVYEWAVFEAADQRGLIGGGGAVDLMIV